MASAAIQQVAEAISRRGVSFPGAEKGVLEKSRDFTDRIAYNQPGFTTPLTFFNTSPGPVNDSNGKAIRLSNMIGNGAIPGNSLVVVNRIMTRLVVGQFCDGEFITGATGLQDSLGVATGASLTDTPFSELKRQIEAIHSNCSISVRVGQREIGLYRGLPALNWTENPVQDGNTYVEALTAVANGYRYSDAVIRNGGSGQLFADAQVPFAVQETESINVVITFDRAFPLGVAGGTIPRGFLEVKLKTKLISNS
jgi:hypothetical protein